MGGEIRSLPSGGRGSDRQALRQLPAHPEGPAAGTSSGTWRSLVSALVWGTRGPEFESRRPDLCYGACRARTGDFQLAKLTLSQLS